MSSMITTVFPTPAPPNAPTLPPLRNGQMRSMGLMPVSKISARVLCSKSDGALRCIGSLSEAATGPFWSIGSPVTLKILPRVAPPTGTFIGDWVSTTSSPRFKPSVEVIATVLTTPPAELLLHFKHYLCAVAARNERIVNCGNRVGGELDVHNRPYDLFYSA